MIPISRAKGREMKERREHGPEQDQNIPNRNPFVDDQVDQFDQPGKEQNERENQ